MISRLKHWLYTKRRPGADTDSKPVRTAFDAEWYLEAYPDVASAGFDPLAHYLKFGQYEGRLPRRNRALAWDFHLWRGAAAVMQTRLERLITDDESSEEESHHARWALARWSVWQGEPVTALAWLFVDAVLIDWPKSPAPAPALLALECLQRTGAEPARLEAIVARLERDFPQSASTALARVNLRMAASESLPSALEPINERFRARGLSTVTLASGTVSALDRLVAAKRSRDIRRGPLVSVIVPAFNAADTIVTAIRSLFAQTWRALEIVVVDDASRDGTGEVLERLRGECPSCMVYTVISLIENQGAYSARNAGLAVAKGALLTTHDSDDWSHPNKIERQVKALIQAEAKAQKSRAAGNGSPVASISFWTRATPTLWCHRWRLEDDEGWVHRNLSSLMFRREVFERLGFWDDVRVNADSEYLARIEAAYGTGAILEVEPELPLAFGRASETSLSQHGDTHLSSQFMGARARYMAAARRWHQRANGALYLSRQPEHRPFPAPAEFLRESPANDMDEEGADERDRIAASGYFDAGWYLRRHPQLHDTRVEALDHYWREGRFQGLDPGPDFSQSGYARQLIESTKLEDALIHFLRSESAERQDPLPVFEGQQPTSKPRRETLLLCGHQAGVQLYGAERSFIDVVKGLHELGYGLVVVLPAALNADYLDTLLAYCQHLVILPYGWWQKGREPEPATVAHFERLIKDFAVDAVSINSLVLDEPLVAAKRCGLPAMVHLRELPREDAALCETMNAEAEWIIESVRARADLLIANSHFTREAFGGQAYVQGEAAQSTRGNIATLPNTIDMQPLLDLPAPAIQPGKILTIGILSSGHANKGLDDLAPLVEALDRLKARVRIFVFGATSPALEALVSRIDESKDHRSETIVELAGYVASPAEALARVDIVLSLSHFEESFGRTALEAMAAGRAFVGYHRGALSEVIGDEAGALVPFGEIEALADVLVELAQSPARLIEMGECGRNRATARFGWKIYVASLEEAYSRGCGRAHD